MKGSDADEQVIALGEQTRRRFTDMGHSLEAEFPKMQCVIVPRVEGTLHDLADWVAAERLLFRRNTSRSSGDRN